MGRNIRYRWFIVVNGIRLEITIDVNDEMRVVVKNELAPGEKIEVEIE